MRFKQLYILLSCSRTKRNINWQKRTKLAWTRNSKVKHWVLTSFTGIQNCFFYIDIAISQRIAKKMKNKRARHAAHTKLIGFFQDKYVTALLLLSSLCKLTDGVSKYCCGSHLRFVFSVGLAWCSSKMAEEKKNQEQNKQWKLFNFLRRRLLLLSLLLQLS